MDGKTMNLNHYIINDKGEIETVDLMTWAKWFESEGRGKRRIALTELPDVHVSTVFMGLDHSFGQGEMQLLETMVFENKETEVDIFGKKHNIHHSLDEYTERYATIEQAKAGHEAIVERMKKLNFWKCEICGRTRGDDFIKVLTYPLKDLPGGERNLKYCSKDTYTDCAEKALEKSLTQEI